MPGPYSGSDPRNYVGIGKQSARATGTAPTVWAAFMEAVDLNHQQSINRILEAGGAGTVTYAEKTSHLPTGGFTILGRPSVTAKLAAYMAGVDTIGAAVSGVTPHTINADLSTDYLSIEQDVADDAIERFVDSVIGEMTFSGSIDNPNLRVKGTWLGGTPAWQASPTAESYETELPWNFTEAAFTVDGSADTLVREFNITWRFIVDLMRVATITPTYIQKLREEVDLDFTKVDTAMNNTGYRKVNYGSTSGTAASVQATPGAFIADYNRGSAATARELKFTIPTLDYDEATYTPLDPNASEGMKVHYVAKGRTTTGVSLMTLLAKNLDAAAYVT